MSTESIREKLIEMSKTRGELKRFCNENKLPYVSVWKFTKGNVERLDYDFGQKIDLALKKAAAVAVAEA